MNAPNLGGITCILYTGHALTTHSNYSYAYKHSDLHNSMGEIIHEAPVADCRGLDRRASSAAVACSS